MRVITPDRPIKNKYRVIDSFGGFNNTENANENEFSFIKNMGHEDYPSLSTVKPYFVHDSLNDPNGLLFFGGHEYTVDYTSFKKDGVTKGTVTNGKKCLIEFNKNILIFPDKKYYDTVNNTFGSFANGTIVAQPNPDIDRATVHNNRVFGVKGANIYASKQGDFKEWNVFEGLLTDSWATDVAGAVEFATIGTYQNHIVLQSGINLYEIYGYNPSNFQVQEVAKVGSIVPEYAEMDSVLYFANRDGVYAYSGGVPRKISGTIKMDILSAKIGTDKKKLYANLYDGSSYHLFVFDSTSKLITRYDNYEIDFFAEKDGKMFAVFYNGDNVEFDSDGDPVNWEFQTVKLIDDYFGNSTFKQIEFNIEMGVGSEMHVFMILENGEERYVKSFEADTQRILKVPMTLLTGCVKVKVTGKGYVKLNAMRITSVRGGSV